MPDQREGDAAQQARGSREAEISARVLRDDEFRDELLRNPVVTLQREYGIGFPEGISVQVHEETDDVFHLVVPGRPSAPTKVSDEQLRQVSGSRMAEGSNRTNCCTCGSSTAQSATSIQTGCGC